MQAWKEFRGYLNDRRERLRQLSEDIRNYW